MKHQDVCVILTRCMASVFILHGLGGSPAENWFPWLHSELETAGHTVHTPTFPNADRPILEEWIQEFERYEDKMNEGTVLVGHSLGGTFAMRYLERAHVPVQATFLVAPVHTAAAGRKCCAQPHGRDGSRSRRPTSEHT